MTATHDLAGAASHATADWQAIAWPQVHRNVRRLQARIVKATREGRWGKVKALQRLLTRSFSGKALAVKRVTDNRGKRTPGVDGATWHTLRIPTKSNADSGRWRSPVPEHADRPVRRMAIGSEHHGAGGTILHSLRR